MRSLRILLDTIDPDSVNLGPNYVFVIFFFLLTIPHMVKMTLKTESNLGAS